MIKWVMLPYDPSDPYTKTLKSNPGLWKDAAMEICRRHSVPVTEFTSFAAGSALVAAMSEDVVIKINQPPYRTDWEAESWALSRMPTLSASLGIEISRQLFAAEEASGWTYIIMTRVPGKQLDLAWPEICKENHQALMFEIGRLMAYVHEHARVESDLAP